MSAIISIRLTNLSPDAQEKLKKVKNKSEFIREAIEAYIQNGQAQKIIELINLVNQIDSKLSNLPLTLEQTTNSLRQEPQIKPQEKSKTEVEEARELLTSSLLNF